ncbi:hypothetical protein [Nitrosopumilus adriaticus]|uniref:hypothetical protein n=1 Tax=Nitrosopumilus adriaticus TaxID=1580092 RepID=UPI00352D40E5
MDKLQSDRLKHFPNVTSLLKISLGLILFTIISTALVYAETISVEVEGTSYDIDYTASGMTLDSIEADTDFISLILTVDVPDSDGVLDITFERSFFDSTFDGLDDDFIILVDGDEPSFTETETTAQSRTLSIDLPAGTEEIEIIGSTFGGSETIPDEEIPDETPVVEDMPEETPDETPEETLDDTPEETPVVTPPKVEEKPAVTTPKVQCGPGTILKDGACVLDERCGPGTILKDGACVLDSTPKPSVTTPEGVGKQMVISLLVAFGIAGIVGVILALIARASKSKN